MDNGGQVSNGADHSGRRFVDAVNEHYGALYGAAYTAEQVSEKLKDAKRRSGLSDRAIAEKYGELDRSRKMNGTKINRYINHPELLKVRDGSILCRAMGTSLSQLCDGVPQLAADALGEERVEAERVLGAYFALGRAGRLLMLRGASAMLEEGLGKLEEASRLADGDELVRLAASRGVDPYVLSVESGRGERARMSLEDGTRVARALLGVKG